MSSHRTNEIASILSGLIGGWRYGIKIRFPHALVMTLLFQSHLPATEKLRIISRLTTEHATNLAGFAALYKLILTVLKKTSQNLKMMQGKCYRNDALSGGGRTLNYLGKNLSSGSAHLYTSQSSHPGIPENARQAAIAGAISGYVVLGRYSSVNYQALLYLFSRLIVGALKLARDRGFPPIISKVMNPNRSYKLFATIIGGALMAMFEEYPHVLHPSLKRSLDETHRFVPELLRG